MTKFWENPKKTKKKQKNRKKTKAKMSKLLQLR